MQHLLHSLSITRESLSLYLVQRLFFFKIMMLAIMIISFYWRGHKTLSATTFTTGMLDGNATEQAHRVWLKYQTRFQLPKLLQHYFLDDPMFFNSAFSTKEYFRVCRDAFGKI